MNTHTAAPTAVNALTRTLYANGRQVSVVRSQEPGQLPVWTIHINGDRPIYVALSLSDATRVADHWATVTA